jgi:hypothetical protein
MGTDLDVVGMRDADVTVIGAQEKSRFETMLDRASRNRRTIEGFRARTLSMATLNADVAAACLYALPRTKSGGEKIKIEGASIRLAEILLKAWRNAGVFAVIVDSTATDVTAQAMFIDFEDLTMVSKQVRSRVLGSHGDARQLAENRAVSIATRNAILGAIPRALWEEAYQKIRETAAGTIETLEERRTEALAYLLANGVSEARVFAALDVDGMKDIGLDQLATLRALVSAVRSGESTAADAFPEPKDDPDPAVQGEVKAKGVAGVKAAVEAKR